MNEVFVKKYWHEEDILFYLHFINGETYRQIELSTRGKVFLTLENPVQGESMLFDQDLEGLDLEKTDFISNNEFENVWNDFESMVVFIEDGNIFNIEGVLNFAHGCNCVGAMGKGIAVQFKNKFPKMYLEYKKLCSEGKFNLGDVYEYNYGKGYVFNLGTQVSWKNKAKLTAIESSLENMLQFALKNNIQQIALPKIGAGLGGLLWEDVKKIIKKVSKKYPFTKLYVVENFQEI